MGQAKNRKAEIEALKAEGVKYEDVSTPEDRKAWGLIENPNELDILKTLKKGIGEFEVAETGDCYMLGSSLSQMSDTFWRSKTIGELATNFTAFCDAVKKNNTFEIATEYLTYAGQRYESAHNDPLVNGALQQTFAVWAYKQGGAWGLAALQMIEKGLVPGLYIVERTA
jgi:hypothetical protein